MNSRTDSAKHYFCTYFDENYCGRAIALIRSLQEHCPEFKMFVLCLDEATYQWLSELRVPQVTPVRLSELENADCALWETKDGRSAVEYCWTCGPAFTLSVLDRVPAGAFLTYLDADLYFFSSPEPIFEELANNSVGIIAHRFSVQHKSREKFGIYNVGWVSFRNDGGGRAVLEWWRQRCIEWCFDVVEDSRFGDQKYLDDWPQKFPGVHVIQNKGANLAAWNVMNYKVSERDGTLFVDETPLIFFHFHGFKQLVGGIYDSNLGRSRRRPGRDLRRIVFGTYIQALKAAAFYEFGTHSLRAHRRGQAGWKRIVRSIADLALGLAFQTYLIEFRGRVL